MREEYIFTTNPSQDSPEIKNPVTIQETVRSETEEAPILFLDVNFGNGEITRIVMYENDTPEELAVAFCVEHKLDESKKLKLIEIIENHMKTMLIKIEEDADE